MPPVATFLGIGALSSLYLLLPFTRVRQWCTAAELRLIGVDAAIHSSSKALPPGPAILISNHLHTVLDTMLVKLLDPTIHVVMKADLLDEVSNN
jgi:1-acyl-sn-glycerol-3-phosphate acyltransferase